MNIDPSVVESAVSGNEKCLDELLDYTRRYSQMIATQRFRLSYDEAEELSQEVTIKVFQNLDKYNPSLSVFDTWLGVVTKNLIIDLYVRNKHNGNKTVSLQEEVGEGLTREDTLESPDSDLLKKVIGDEMEDIAIPIIDQMPPLYGEPIVLCYFFGFSYEQAAEFLEIPIGTFKSRIHRGVKLLQRRLKRYSH